MKAKHILFKCLLVFIFHFSVFTSLLGQQLYHQWLGPKDAAKTLVFLHGGPGYNSANFEFDMAPRLAKMGYQVLVYYLARQTFKKWRKPSAKNVSINYPWPLMQCFSMIPMDSWTPWEKSSTHLDKPPIGRLQVLNWLNHYRASPA